MTFYAVLCSGTTPDARVTLQSSIKDFSRIASVSVLLFASFYQRTYCLCTKVVDVSI
jgi:hypothetical protein